jgi:hypothetical protein
VGVDAMIFCKAEGKPINLRLPPDYRCGPARYEQLSEGFAAEPGDLYEIDTDGERYYNQGYERGYWPRICTALMSLLNSPNVTRVWYYGDCHWLEDQRPITVDDVLEISRYYILNGNRAYKQAATSTT